MKITHKATVTDYIAAYRMFLRKNFVPRYDEFLWPGFTLLCLAVISAGDHRSVLNGIFRLLLIFAVVFSVGLPLLRRFNGYRNYREAHRKSPAPLGTTTEIKPEGIIEATGASSEREYTWSNVTGFGQNARITLFLMANSYMIFFPTALLDSNQRGELDHFISEQGIKRWS